MCEERGREGGSACYISLNVGRTRRQVYPFATPTPSHLNSLALFTLTATHCEPLTVELTAPSNCPALSVVDRTHNICYVFMKLVSTKRCKVHM